MRVLEKSNYLKMNRLPTYQGREKEASKTPLFQAIALGETETISGIIRYLIFESSPAMVAHLKKSKVNMEIRYLAEAKFLKHISKVLMDLFKYRV